MTKVKWMAAMAAKSLGYGMRIHINLHAVVILANTEWATQHIWGAEISVAHRNIVSKYIYNHVHDAEIIREILQIIATADAARDQKKIKGAGRIGRHGQSGDEQDTTADATTAGDPPHTNWRAMRRAQTPPQHQTV